MKGLKGQGQPCSEPLKFVLKILRILKKWDWAQGMVHQNKNNSLLFFCFCSGKTGKGNFIFGRKKIKSTKEINLLLFFVLLFYKKHQEILSSALLTS